METILVNKFELLDKLKKNREIHTGTFEKALEAYKQKSIQLLEEHIERIKSGTVEKVHVSLPVPQNYEEEYDKAIEMVEWHRDEHIELDSYRFDMFVRDNWQWKKEFNQTNMVYGVKN